MSGDQDGCEWMFLLVFLPVPQIRSHDFWHYINLYVCMNVCTCVIPDQSPLNGSVCVHLKVFYTVSGKNDTPDFLAITLSNLSYFQWCNINGNETDVLVYLYKVNSQFLLAVFVVCVCTISDKLTAIYTAVSFLFQTQYS